MGVKALWGPSTRTHQSYGGYLGQLMDFQLNGMERDRAEKVVPHRFEQRPFFGDYMGLVQHPGEIT